MKRYVATFKHFRGFYYLREYDELKEFEVEIAEDIASEVCWAYVVSSDGHAQASYTRGQGVSY